MDLTVLLEPSINLARLEHVLNDLGHSGRLATVRGWEPKTLTKLYEAAKGHHPLTLEHFVPASIGPLTEVIHHGKNSLPLFSHFQKRFTRPDAKEDAPKELWGGIQNILPIPGIRLRGTNVFPDGSGWIIEIAVIVKTC